MQRIDGHLVFSATDLNNFLACEHLGALDLQVLEGELARPDGRPEQAELLARLGEEHERAYLQRLSAEGSRVTAIARAPGIAGIRAAAAATEAAMERGDAVIYQATFFDDVWLGYADFLRRVDEPLSGGRWLWHYEVEDTKLARHTEPYFLLQLAYYSAHLARLQGAAPRSMHVVLGTGARVSFRVEDYAAYYRAVRARFLAHVERGTAATYPEPVPHCGLCAWNQRCEQRRRRDDHLSLVANSTRLQRARLTDAGVTTVRALAEASLDRRPEKMAVPTFETLRRQARLQHEQRLALAAGEEHPYRYELLESGLTGTRGFLRLPKPSPGDVFFDMEGDPYYDLGTGLEYLFGAHTPEGDFHAFWGCDRAPVPARDRLAEKRAFEAFVDFVMARRRQHPDLHVYHYASYEKTALLKLSQRHATREDEVDEILRAELLVDLYAVVRQAIAVGHESYSIKKLEDFYGKRGDESAVKAGDDSILRFEAWLGTRTNPARRDDAILDDLERYNRYDCVSTQGLRDWLLVLRAEAERTFDRELPPYAGKEPEIAKPDTKNVEVKAALDARLPADFEPDDPAFADLRPFYLARHMLEYHWREHKPVYWRFHDRCEAHQKDPEALLDDAESIVGLELVAGPHPVRKSQAYEFRYPLQLHKLDGGDAFDPDRDKKRTGKIIAIEDGDEFGRLVLERGPSLAELPLPTTIVTRKIVQPSTILDSLVRFAQALLANQPHRYRAAMDLLLSAPPRLRGTPPGAPIQPPSPDEHALRALCDALDESYLFVQGPPGAGKTYVGARLIVGLIADGKRVGVTANSHKAIHNLLDEVERVAAARGVRFVGVKKCSEGEDDSYYHGPSFRNDDKTLAHPDADLVAGTAWAFGAEAMDASLPFLFIDEAGQVALPHAVAVSTAAENVVLLGDPLQLPQVAHTQHPGDLGASVLEHLLDRELRPVTPERGVLLTDSYRMHPDVCRFISELLYEGKLRAAPGRECQQVRSPGLSGTGLRHLPVLHEGNTQRSDEEAARIADEIALLLQGEVRDAAGDVRCLVAADVIVVTPYNAQVRAIRRLLDARGLGDVEVGTVDKFQGREAYVVFFSTAASSPDEAPRGVAFVFDRQRFNVAISRARALAVVVGSPRLMEQRPSSVDDVLVANGVYRFIEEAGEPATPARPTAAPSLR
jgi:uncharacterized protein